MIRKRLIASLVLNLIFWPLVGLYLLMKMIFT